MIFNHVYRSLAAIPCVVRRKTEIYQISVSRMGYATIRAAATAAITHLGNSGANRAPIPRGKAHSVCGEFVPTMMW